MSTSKRIAQLFDRRIARRIIIVPLVLVAAILGVVLSPLLLSVAAIADLAKGRRRWPRVRLVVLVVGALIVETIGLFVSLFIWVVSGFGLLGRQRWRWHRYRVFMGRYTQTMFALVARVIGSKVIWQDRGDLSRGPAVVIARHTSFFDALIPATVVSRRNQLLAHHVVAHGLRYAPCIDIVGHRLPNQFVKRDPGEGSTELGPIQAIGAVLDDRSAAIIFPEGTFRSPERFARVVRRIGRRDPELAARAQHLDHVLPPRANGTHALLLGAPEADVVVCANTGLESFGSIKSIVNHPYADRPIVIGTWRIPRAEIPDDPTEFNLWLFDQYVAIDAWVTDQQAKTS